MTTRTYDWKPQFDERSKAFRFMALDCWARDRERTSILRTKSVFLDQGQEGACSGFGEEHVRALTPRPQIVSNTSAHDVYIEARFQDEYPGENYSGSSVNGAMKAARLKGYIRNWHWCMALAELRHALSYHGAVEAGTDFYAGMEDTDSDGNLHMTGDIVGGHAYAIAGYRAWRGTRRYRMENSWGEDWGDHGGAWILEDDMQALLAAGAEFACPVKIDAR